MGFDELVHTLRRSRTARIQRALLSEDTRRDSQQNVSIVFVLLATAAFVAFARSPQQPPASEQVRGADLARHTFTWPPVNNLVTVGLEHLGTQSMTCSR
jgi:hypothetical protein